MLALSAPAAAQDVRAPIALDPLVIKRAQGQTTAGSDAAGGGDEAATTEQPGSNVPQSVQVIERAQIQRQLELSPSPAAALAKLVPGYSVANGTISGASETFRGRQVLVMIDGVPMNTPLRDVSRIMSMIDLNAVERIEVVAGASSLYGSNATGGTVNFVTIKPTDGKPQVTVNTAMRAFTANVKDSLAPEVSASITGKAQNGLDYVVVGSGRFADKTFDGAGRELPSDGMLGQGGGDRFGAGNLLAKFGYDLNAHQRFEVSANWIYLNQEPDWMTSYSQPFARPDYMRPYTGESVLEDTKSLSARYSDTSFGLGKLTLLGFYYEIEKRFNYSEFDPLYNTVVYYSGHLGSPTASYNQTALHTQRSGVNATVETPLTALLPGTKLIWGGDIVHESTSQTLTDGQDVFNPLEQTSYAAFAQLQVPIGDRVVVRGGVRYEHFDLTVDDFVRPAAFLGFAGLGYAVLPSLPVEGGEFSYASPTFNLGATVKLTEAAELYGGFSQGFNLPDVGAFTRRAGQNGGTADILFYGCYLGLGPLPSVSYNCPKMRTLSYASIAPETQIVDNYELGIRTATASYRANLVGFISMSENGVSFDAATNTISQQEELIYGVEFFGELVITKNFSLGTVLTYREGKYDSDKDGHIDSHLPNNRIATPFRGIIYVDYRFDNDWMLHVEGEGWSGRDVAINKAGSHFPIEPAFIVNAALSVPWEGGRVYLGAGNIFDVEYENPTATSVRNLPVNGWGRTLTIGYRKSF